MTTLCWALLALIGGAVAVVDLHRRGDLANLWTVLCCVARRGKRRIEDPLLAVFRRWTGHR